MEQRRRHKDNIVLIDGTSLRYGDTSCSAGCIIVPLSLDAGVPSIKIYASLDGTLFKFIAIHVLALGTIVEVENSGLFAAIRIDMVDGDATISVSSYWN